MNIEIIDGKENHKSEIFKMLEDFLLECGILDKSIETIYDFGYNIYWENPNYLPILIRCENKNIGFILVNDFYVASEFNCDYSLGDIYLKKEFRDLGIKKIAIKKLFEIYKGKWKVRRLFKNMESDKYLKELIREVTNGEYEEKIIQYKDTKLIMQIFETH